MQTSTTKMKKILEDYFEAWRTQDSEMLCSLFTDTGIYKVKPFGLEEYAGKDKIREYWAANPVSKQVNPRPELITSAFGDNICFAEWETISKILQNTKKTTRGMLLLEFNNGLIQELREHYLSTEI